MDIPVPTDEQLASGAEHMLHRRGISCLSYWFPKLLQADLPVPRTRIVPLPTVGVSEDLYRVLDGQPIGERAQAWLGVLQLATDEIGYPCFLRTGETSNKHEWEKTCFLSRPEDLASHVLALIEFSEIADFMGLAWNVWVVREMLPTTPVTTVYRGMPLCREFRFFVEDDTITCCHPYWPEQAVRDGFRGREIPEDFDEMCEFLTTSNDSEREHIVGLAEAAGAAVGGKWSVDILQTMRGWYITDMAVAHQSWHWPGCPQARSQANDRRDW